MAAVLGWRQEVPGSGTVTIDAEPWYSRATDDAKQSERVTADLFEAKVSTWRTMCLTKVLSQSQTVEQENACQLRPETCHVLYRNLCMFCRG